MPKWIETKRKTVEITVKILKWWCITVITVNTQTIGNSSNSLHHNTYMDPQPPLQATRGFENNFSMASLCMIFASLKTYAQKQSKKISQPNDYNTRISALHILIMKKKKTTLPTCWSSNFPRRKFPTNLCAIFKFSLITTLCSSLFQSLQKKWNLHLPHQFSFLLMKFLYLFWQYCWILLMMNIREKCWWISQKKWKPPWTPQSLCATTPFIRLLLLLLLWWSEEPLNFHIPIHIHHCVKKCSI